MLMHVKTEIPVKTLPNGLPTSKTILDLQKRVTLMGCQKFKYRGMKTKIVVEVVVPGGISSAHELGTIISEAIKRNSVGDAPNA